MLISRIKLSEQWLRRLAIVFITFILLFTSPYSAWADEGHAIIATWNIEWFFDADTSDNSQVGQENSAPNDTEYQERVNTIAEAISEINPTILALQEVENQSVVEDLANRLETEFDLDFEVSRFSFPPDSDDDNLKDLSKHAKLETSINGEDLTLVNVHLITRTNNRLRQARTLRAWLDNEMATTSEPHIIVLGDFNTSQRFNQTTPDSEMGIIRGFQTQTDDDDLFDVNQLINSRATHVSKRELDRVLLSPSLLDEQGLRVKDVEIRRDLAIIGNEDQGRGVSYDLPINEQDLSDHFPLIVTLNVS